MVVVDAACVLTTRWATMWQPSHATGSPHVDMSLASLLLDHAEAVRRRPRIRDPRLRQMGSKTHAEVWSRFPLYDPQGCLALAEKYKNSRDSGLRTAAVVAQEHAQGESPELSLIRRLECRNAEDRTAATLLLAFVGTSRSVPALCERLHDVSPEVQAGAAFALQEIGDTRAIAPLLELLKKSIEGRTLRLRSWSMIVGLALLPFLLLIYGPIILILGHQTYLFLAVLDIALLTYALISLWRQPRANYILPDVAHALARLGDYEHIEEMRETSAELKAVAESRTFTVPNRQSAQHLANFIDDALTKHPSRPIPAQPPKTAIELLPSAAAPTGAEPDAGQEP
jgi:hypothetical protein